MLSAMMMLLLEIPYDASTVHTLSLMMQVSHAYLRCALCARLSLRGSGCYSPPLSSGLGPVYASAKAKLPSRARV